MSRAPLCINLVVIEEGSTFTDLPLDKGGPTRYGITLGRVKGIRNPIRPDTAANIQNMSAARAIDLYTKGEWATCMCEHLPAGIDYAMLDAAVNSGPTRAVRWAQQAVGLPQAAQDGVMGPATLAAILRACMTPESTLDVLSKMLYYRQYFLLNLNNAHEEAFEKGWVGRLITVAIQGSRMIAKL